MTKVDAFNESKCGHIRTVPFQWMLREQSFICRPSIDWDDFEDRRQPGRSLRVSGGFSPQLGQFPSHVQVINQNEEGSWGCGGVLIHHDLVLTAARCVDRNLSSRVEVISGTLMRSNSDRMGESSEVSMSCVPGDFEGSENDWAILKLSSPFKYGNNIQPACLNLAQRPLKNTACVAVGMGQMDTRPSSGAKQLQATLVKQCKDHGTTSTCWVGINGQGQMCRGDEGNAVYCWDNCRSSTRAFAVGVLSSTGHINSCRPNGRGHFQFSDFYKSRGSIRKLMKTCLGRQVDREKQWSPYRWIEYR